MCNNKNKRSVNVLSWCIFLFWTGFLVFVQYYHEPWFDEAQAWMIARHASIFDIVFEIPHYEGHPPLWHLVLLPFAKNNMPYEITIKLLNMLFSSISCWLIIFKSPFHLWIRLVTPFTFFFFYQYSVISRPYSLFILGIILVAMLYKNKNEFPGKFVLALAFVCSTTLYGVLIAFGICLAWLVELLREYPSKTLLKIVKHKKLWLWVLCLAVYALFIVLLVFPKQDTYAANLEHNNSKIYRLIYMLLITPSDMFFTDNFNAIMANGAWNGGAYASIFLGSTINYALYSIAHIYKKSILLLIPSFLLAIFGAFFYFSIHHIGLFAVLYFFVFWCCLSDPPAIVTLPKQITRLARTPRDWHLLGVASNLFLVALMSTSLFWTFSSVLIEYSSNYGNGRDMAEFIQSHEMDKLTIVAQWKNTIDSETYEQEVDFNQMRGVVLLPYFDNNIISNLNPDSREPYLIHKIDKEGTSIAKLLANKLPDMLIGRAEIEAIYNNKQVINNYAMINYFRGNTIWKGHKMSYIDILFMRRELLKKYPDISEKKYVDINAG